jgi:hypothetical protein
LLGFFLPFIAARVLSHVEPLLHQSFTIAVGVRKRWRAEAAEVMGRRRRWGWVQRNKTEVLFVLWSISRGRRRNDGDSQVIDAFVRGGR